MSREIKFRAWSKVERKMYACFGFMSGQVLIIKDNIPTGIKDEYFELMQFTGLHDKNGREIYEGDIIQRPDVGVPMLVRWNAQEVRFDLTRKPDNFKSTMIWWTGITDTDYEIIGNIYENPGLIEGGDA
jgi:YopX protein